MVIEIEGEKKEAPVIDLVPETGCEGALILNIQLLIMDGRLVAKFQTKNQNSGILQLLQNVPLVGQLTLTGFLVLGKLQRLGPWESLDLAT